MRSLSNRVVFVSNSKERRLAYTIRLISNSVLLLIGSSERPKTIGLLSVGRTNFLPRGEAFPPHRRGISVAFRTSTRVASSSKVVGISCLYPLLFSE